jgi:hypothetical protein
MFLSVLFILSCKRQYYITDSTIVPWSENLPNVPIQKRQGRLAEKLSINPPIELLPRLSAWQSPIVPENNLV